MIKGLKLFQERFKRFSDQYVLIGGSACWVLMNESGLRFRRTRDLDIVLMVETLTPEFRIEFQKFLREGQYSMKAKSGGLPCFFRFNKPNNIHYPDQIEFLSWDEQAIESMNPGEIVQMSIEDEVTSLAAILMDHEMYEYVKRNTVKIDGLPIADETCLIPLKVRAWVDLSSRKEKGENIKGDEIKKHKNDVYLLQQLLIPKHLTNVPVLVKSDIKIFIESCDDADPILKQIGVLNTTIQDIKNTLSLVYLD